MADKCGHETRAIFHEERTHSDAELAAVSRLALSRAAVRRGWRHEALAELLDLADLHDIDVTRVRL